MKKLLVSLLLAGVLVSGAWAQFAVGATGALYSDSEMTAEEFLSRMDEGEGVFYGPFFELGLDNLALGLAMNFSFMEIPFVDGLQTVPVELMEYDVNLYAQYHVFSYGAFLDPFLEAGLGMMALDFADAEYDLDPENPLLGSNYFHAGGGVGINLGGLGIFFKGLYMFKSDEPVVAETSYTDKDGNAFTYDIAEYPLKKLKLLLGAKLSF